jgi:hypothetical protein
MPLLGITLWVTPIRLDNSSGVAHIPTASTSDKPFFSLERGTQDPSVWLVGLIVSMIEIVIVQRADFRSLVFSRFLISLGSTPSSE